MRPTLLALSALAFLASSHLTLAQAGSSPEAVDNAGHSGEISPAPNTTLTLEPPPLEPQSLSILTYNPGLARGAVFATEARLPQVIDALGQATEDVICLQEVWNDGDAKAIQERLAATHPYAFSHRTTDESKATTPCGIIKTLRLSRCVTNKCEAEGISIFECVGAGGVCEPRYDAVSDDCKRCLGANTPNPTSCAVGGAQDYAWEGHNGLLLLSKYPLEEAEYLPMDAKLVARGALKANVKDYQILCTHLSADLGVLPYPPGAPVDSWEGEHLAQLQGLSDAAGDRCTVLMGDLNAGPEGEGLVPEFGANFSALEALGFSEPHDAPPCTWCSDNNLTGGDANSYIDHIMVKGCPEGIKLDYHRAMDQPITIEGQEGGFYLSDHFGVSATLSQ